MSIKILVRVEADMFKAPTHDLYFCVKTHTVMQLSIPTEIYCIKYPFANNHRAIDYLFNFVFQK